MQFRINEDVFEPELGLRSSLGFVKDTHDSSTRVRNPLGDYQTMLDLLRRDPVIMTAFNIFVKASLSRGFDFIQGSKKQRNDARELFEDLNWLGVDSNLKYQSLNYGDAFLELRKQDSRGRPDELWPLESTEMRINYDVHGKIPDDKAYVQRPFNITSDMTTGDVEEQERTHGQWFSKEQVIHFRTVWIGSQVYSYIPMESASTAISSKLFSTNYLMNIFNNMPPGYLAHLAGGSEKARKTLKTELQSTKTNYKRRIAVSSSPDVQSKLQIQKLDPPYDTQLLDVIRYFRREILMLTHVPQSWVEESAGENRGITESEQRPFDIAVKYFQMNPYEMNVNRHVMPLLGFKTKGTEAKKKIKFKYNALHHKEEKEILLNASMLQNFGAKPEALVRYLDNRGILGFDPTDFDVMQMGKNMETNPSRQRMDKSTDTMTNKLDSQGVSAQGKAKSEEVSMRSGQEFGKYPYEMS
jgi:hypothetical protein